MIDGIHIVICSRPGCGKECGAVKVKMGTIVERELHPHVREEDGLFYCGDCYECKDEFKDPLEGEE